MKKLLLILLNICFIYNLLFALELKLIKVHQNLPFFYGEHQIIWFADNGDLLCVFDNEKLYYANTELGTLKEIDDVKGFLKIANEIERSSKIDLDFGYQICLEPIPDEINQAQILDNRVNFLITDKESIVVFDYNKWRIDRKELQPEFYYNSVNEKKNYSDSEKKRQLEFNKAFTGKVGNVAVNLKKNIIGIILNDYNSVDNGLLIFSIIYDGTVNDNRVRLRTAPDLKGETFGYINTGDKVKIIDRSYEKQKIENMENYWYMVELSDGKTGWVYGAYVDVK